MDFQKTQLSQSLVDEAIGRKKVIWLLKYLISSLSSRKKMLLYLRYNKRKLEEKFILSVE